MRYFLIILLALSLTSCSSFYDRAKRRFMSTVTDTTYQTITTRVPKDSAVYVLKTDTTHVVERFRQGRATVTIIREPTNTTVIANCDSVAIQKKIAVATTRQIWGVDPKYKDQATKYRAGFFGLVGLIVLVLLIVWLLSRFRFRVERKVVQSTPS